MLKKIHGGEITVQDGYECVITCDHCFKRIMRFYVNMEQGYGGLYQPQLCEKCWTELGNRIHELTEKENKLEKLEAKQNG